MYLNTHSYYSFKYGTLSHELLLELARQGGIEAFALTDINNTSACLDFVRQAPKYGVKPIIGIDFRNGAQQQFVALAKDNTGFRELNYYLTQCLKSGANIPAKAPELPGTYIIYPFDSFKGSLLKEHEFIGVRPRDLNRLKLSPWRFRQDKLVALQTLTFRNKRDFNAHRLLRAIDNNILLSQLPKSEEGHPEDRLLHIDQLRACYADYPKIIQNTERLLSSCNIHFDFGSEHEHKNLRYFSGSDKSDYELVKAKCYEGMAYRYGHKVGSDIKARLQKELDIIANKGFLSYFLISEYITSYARRKGYFYVGRGSGANSIIAYLLRITDVDPIELDLYFERFINLYRKNPPDFDIDFSWVDREDVTRQIFKRFPDACLLATYSTFKQRAVVRELGKVFGLPKAEIDVLSEGKYHPGRLDEMAGLVLKYSQLIQGFPSHLSVHAGGILIPEGPIQQYTATITPPKGFPTTQFDMVIAEDVGLYKFDILGQRGLAKIKDALALIPQNNPADPPIDIHDLPRFKEDPRIKSMLRQGQAIGCFYVESPAMRMLLKKLMVDDYLGLVAASSVIRPGVAKSGMMRQYILRFRNPELREEAHPILAEIMPETFGVMVYQEDVIKVAHHFAGLDLGEADVLRRGMSGKYRSREEFQRVKDSYFRKCREKGHSDELALDVWRQIESFAGYAFAKGHSASYAVESYQSLFLKAYYPLEYMVATINNGGGFYRAELYVHEARLHGAQIHAPCVNQSLYTTIVYGRDIYLGLGMLHELESNVVEQLLIEREQHGLFQSFDDFIDRVKASVDQVSILIRIDAFRFTGKQKRALLWEAHLKLSKHTPVVRQLGLFSSARRNYTLPVLHQADFEDAFDQLELLGFPLCSPFLLSEKQPGNRLLARDFPRLLGQEISIWGYLVHIKGTTTSKGGRMNFGTFIDQEGQFIDSTHFPPVAARYPFQGRGVYVLTGLVVEEFGFYSLEITRMRKEAMIQDPRYTEAKGTEKKITNKALQGMVLPAHYGPAKDTMRHLQHVNR